MGFLEGMGLKVSFENWQNLDEGEGISGKLMGYKTGSVRTSVIQYMVYIESLFDPRQYSSRSNLVDGNQKLES